MKLVIIDYGMGNIRSVEKAFARIGLQPIISSDPKVINTADKLILPGVGHFKKGIENLRKFSLFEILNELVTKRNIPILGICLGMQLMTEFSEEGNCYGFGWVKARTVRFSFNNKLKIPHMGWNNLFIQRDNVLLKNISEEDLFYFVHSYYIICNNNQDILSTTNYGVEFVSSFNYKNIFGTQFHPEKSHQQGLQIIKNFVDI